MLRCSIDASNRDGGIFTVAAVTYGLDAAKKANRHWPHAALKGRAFHMTDLNARQGEFRGITDSEMLEIMTGAVGTACNYSSSVVAVSCDAREVEAFLPRVAARDTPSQEILGAMRSPYGLMCHLCMTAVGRMCRGSRDVAYTLESGDEGQRGVLRYLEFVENHPHAEMFRDLYSFRSKNTGTKADIEGIFHAADLVAWEFGTHAKRRLAGDATKRTSFERIAAGTNNYFRYFAPESIRHFLEAYRRILPAEKRQEDVDEAIRFWRDVRKEALAKGQTQFFPVRFD